MRGQTQEQARRERTLGLKSMIPVLDETWADMEALWVSASCLTNSIILCVTILNFSGKERPNKLYHVSVGVAMEVGGVGRRGDHLIY